jgi:hypothetical protein
MYFGILSKLQRRANRAPHLRVSPARRWAKRLLWVLAILLLAKACGDHIDNAAKRGYHGPTVSVIRDRK